MTTDFRCVTLASTCLGFDAVRASLRAGGTALLDIGPDAAAPLALPADLPADGDLGLRLAPAQAGLADRLGGRPHCLVLTGWDRATLAGTLHRLARPDREIWLEARDADDLTAAGDDVAFAGWLGRGSECGGRSGRQSAFVLGQALARQSRRFWVQGGIGPHSAAACRALGAAGVVLDDALLLLRDSGLPPSWRAVIAGLGSDDTQVAGGEWGEPWRFACRHDLAGGRTCAARAAQIATSLPEAARPAAWRDAAAGVVGWGDPATQAWPLGQAVGQAQHVADRHGSIGRLVRAIREDTAAQVAAAARLAPLAEGAALARAHGTRYPIVQGPMTRVSDTVRFAAEVAAAGALPLLALATMSGPQAAALLDDTGIALAGRPWGIGLLGYIEPGLAAAQFAAVARARPRFALIAGGRPDQAARLEAAGIATYIHVSSPETLRLFLDQGARRFVLEGAECGGHVGPLSSFALWDAMTAVLAGWRGDRPQVLFAGGIHDARSAAAVAALAAPLAEASIGIGVLMGTAYLFTVEAVQAGGITAGFQRAALDCRRTVLIETRPGHRIRCMPTDFVARFAARRADLLASGCPPTELAETLEALVTGRLRIASKAQERDGDRLRTVPEEHARTEGLFMVGDAATLCATTQSCAMLHQDVSAGATTLLQEAAARAAAAPPPAPSGVPVAIIGIGCLLPGAHDAQALWRNLLDEVALTEEVPAERWDWRLYYDPDPAARDRITSRWGCFLKPLPLDPLHYGIPPNSLHSICLPQLLALEATRLAIEDAGAGGIMPDDRLRDRTAVIFGVGSAGDLEQMFKARSALPLVDGVGEDALARLPEWTEESYPGILLNVVAGRVANRFDFGGPNFTVDAACASSLAALDLAVRELQSGRSDLALAGAVDAELSPHAYTAFSKTGALSPTGRARPFDEAADGIVLSEGAVVLVLKRLAEAERDGDRIYATIRGVAGSSDGKGMGMTAPRPAGQAKALERAHQASGTDIATLGFYEAHATGTRVGDRAELETLTTVLRRAGAPAGQCAVGAAKSLLGHTRSTAGLVGTVKAALALHHRVLPPQSGVAAPLQPLRDPDAPIYLPARPLPWLRDAAAPRRAGVSAFGFGGTNFHAVLEEHRDAGPDGGARWPIELIALAADDRDGMLAAIDRLDRACASVGETIALRDLAFSCAVAADRRGPFRLAVTAGAPDELRRMLAEARSQIAGGEKPPAGAAWSAAPAGGDLAFLFPGQGAQCLFMGAELALFCPELHQALQATPARAAILPCSLPTAEARVAAEQALAATAVAQPAIAAVSCGMLDLARRIGLRTARVAGHSFGEFVALHAAGVLDRDDLLRLAAERGRMMAKLGADAGAMAAVALDLGELAPVLDGIEGVWIANLNAPRQIVVSGATASVEALLARLATGGHTARRLPVAAAFHSPLVGAARTAFADFLAGSVDFAAPRLPVHANRDGRPYPTAPAEILRRCCEHMEQKVDFIAQVEAMWQAGARSFLELGPGRTLTGLVGQILGERPHLALPADGGLRGWLGAVARLWTAGHEVALEACFAGRPVRLVDLDRLPADRPAPEWQIDGGRVRRRGEPGLVGAQPFRTADSPVPAAPNGPADTAAAAYAEYQATMRHFLEQQERVLSRLLQPSPPTDATRAQPASPVLPAPSADSPPAPVEPAPPRDGTLDAAALTATLLRLVSERTGYPLHILRPEQDLEAELGVDSIKRIEIIGRLIKTQPADIAERLQQRFELLVRARSADLLVDAILQSLHSVQAPPDRRDSVPATPAEVCPRYVMRPIAKPLPDRGPRALTGLYLVTPNLVTPHAEGLVEAVAAGLRSHGAVVCVLPATDPAHVAAQLRALRATHGPVRGLVHLAALGLTSEPAALGAWRAATAAATKHLFALLQACGAEMADAAVPLRVVAVSPMRGDALRLAADGGAHGILRSAVREFPHMLGKVVAFDVDCAAALMAERIVRETLIPGGGDEIGYRHGERFFLHPEPAPLDAAPAREDWRPGPGAVVLATGGARGITASICRELAAPGVRLVLVGRAAAATGEERAANLRAFRDAGAEVEYHGLDVGSQVAFGGLIDALYARYGRIDAVLHGAGVIEDQRFAAKTRDSFDRVFDVKADSGFILARHLRPEDLRWVVLFGSISGRFGNSGQADYAAANETLARIGRWMNARWPATRVVTIQWGPWRGTGMASEDVQRLLGSQGIVPIEPASGRRFFVDELRRGGKADAEVIAGQGPWSMPPDQDLGSVFASLMPLLHPRGSVEPEDAPGPPAAMPPPSARPLAVLP